MSSNMIFRQIMAIPDQNFCESQISTLSFLSAMTAVIVYNKIILLNFRRHLRIYWSPQVAQAMF